MSMSRKIFTLISLLVLLSFSILGLAVYSMMEIAAVADYLVSLGNRSAALHNIDKAILDRIIQIREINASTDENAIAALVNGDFAENEKIVSSYIAEYDANIPKDADQSMREVSSTLTALWNNFVAESKKVAEFSLENTNNKAARINDDNFSFWQELEAAFVQLADLLISRGDPAGVKDSMDVLNIRADLVHIQLTMVKFIHETDKEVSAKYKAGIGQFVDYCDVVMNRIAATAPPDKGGRLAKQIFDNLMVGKGKPIIGEILQLVERDTNTLSNRQMLGPTSDAIQKARSFTEDSLADISASQGQAREMTNAMIRDHLTLMLAASLICITVISIVSWRIIKDTIGRLRRVVEDIEESSSIVSQASDKISNTSHSLSGDVAAQAASLEETSASLEEMDSTTRQNADNVAKATDTMNTAFTLVNSGAETVKHNISAMTEISESAGQIGNIIKMIEDIAFQTNLLALNASVEAARAGEAGKGFAVVADEVRNLAQRSSQAARDTSGLIRKTVERIQAGSENVGNLSRSFAEIEQAVGNMKRLIVEISSATNEQAQEVGQVSKAVTQIDKNTQGTAAEAEELSSASMELMQQAEQLNTVIKVVHELVAGKGTHELLIGKRAPIRVEHQPGPH